MRNRFGLFILGFALVAVLGYLVARTAAPPPKQKASERPEPVAAVEKVVEDEPAPKFRRGVRMPDHDSDVEAALAGAIEGQRVLVFEDQEALARFLARAGDSVSVLGRLDALNALLVKFSNYDDLAALLDGDEEESFVFPVVTPNPGEGTVQAGAVALGNRLLEWLGITVDNSGWGKGVTVAVLDTGVAASLAFSSSIRSLNLVGLPSDLSLQNGHGTAVASMIIGDHSMTPGVAPGADVVSIRIADDNGVSNSFLLAQGIITAVQSGAQLINISMGSYGDSALVRNAIDYAISYGVLIVAAAGNNGIDHVYYPAANNGVIAVGAVDAMGNHLSFSNTGDQIDISAPGYGLYAAWTGDQVINATGTSFSAPIVTGVIAAVMTATNNGNLTAQQAWQLVTSYLNDTGAAGKDSASGAGMPNVGRVLDGNTPGIYDAAVASSQIIQPTTSYPNGQVQVLVQNQGTETLINTRVSVSTGGGTVSSNITTLAPNEVKTVLIPISKDISVDATNLSVVSSVSLTNGETDLRPSNNSRIDTYVSSDSR